MKGRIFMLEKKTMPVRLLLFVLTLVMGVFAIPLTAGAASQVELSVPNGVVRTGDEFVIAVGFSADENIGTVQAAIAYSESSMEFVSGDGAFGGGGIVNINSFPDSQTNEMTIRLTFKAIKSGDTQISLTNGNIISPDGLSLDTSLSATASLTIEGGASESGIDTQSTADSGSATESNATDGLTAVLKSLTVEVGELQPAFSPGIYDYTVKVSHDVNVFELEGETASLTDTIWYEGALYLVDGKNQRTITVTSADGTVSNVYTITIYRDYADTSSDDMSSVSDTESSSDLSYDSSEYADFDSSGVDAQTDFSDSDRSSSKSSAVSFSDSSESSGSQDLRDKLMPALYIAVGVLVLAAIIIAVWIKNKSKNKLK